MLIEMGQAVVALETPVALETVVALRTVVAMSSLRVVTRTARTIGSMLCITFASSLPSQFY